MKTSKRTVKIFAKKFRLDPIEALVFLWDYENNKAKFSYLKNESSAIRAKDLNIARKILTNIVNKDNVESCEKITPQVVYVDYDFSSMGKVVSPIKYLNKGEILIIHNELVRDFASLDDPISPSGIKNDDMLESAIFHAQTSYGDVLKYPTIESSAAALIYALSNNHAFHNGNKRTAMVSMLVYLDRHHLFLECEEDELFKISLEIADHNLISGAPSTPDAEIYKIAGWIVSKCKKISKGERNITYRRLKQILSSFNCKFLDKGRIERIVSSSFCGIPHNKKLYSAFSEMSPDGHNVNKRLIKKIREDLELDPDHGIDIEQFYSGVGHTASEFVVKYTKLLRRLSRT